MPYIYFITPSSVWNCTCSLIFFCVVRSLPCFCAFSSSIPTCKALYRKSFHPSWNEGQYLDHWNHNYVVAVITALVCSQYNWYIQINTCKCQLWLKRYPDVALIAFSPKCSTRNHYSSYNTLRQIKQSSSVAALSYCWKFPVWFARFNIVKAWYLDWEYACGI